MRLPLVEGCCFARYVRRTLIATAWTTFAFSFVLTASAATTFDGENGTSWWFDPINWSPNSIGEEAPFFPPSSGDGLTRTDANINLGVNLAGDGVVYDPDNDPFFSAAATDFDYPTEDDSNLDRDTFWRFYVTSGAALTDNKVTMKSGTFELIDDNEGATSGGALIIGRGGTNPGLKGTIVQQGGSFLSNDVDMDIGHFQTNRGTGIYDYQGGILEVALASGAGIRIGHAGSTGPAGDGTFIMRNGGDTGYVRTWNFSVASGLGAVGTPSDSLGIVEFHANEEGTRPIQILNNLSLNNQDDSAGVTGSTRSPILKLVLDAAPEVNESGVPVDLGLFDVDFDDDLAGFITGTANADGNETPNEDTDQVFSNATDTDIYGEGSIVSAIFGSTQYNWTISYTGDISWDDDTISDVGTILGPGNGTDVVLMGLGSENVGLIGDYNNDGKVSAADYTVWRDHYGAETLPNRHPDNTGPVDEDDFETWIDTYGSGNFGSGASSVALTTVPEPSSIALAILGIIAISSSFRSRVFGTLRPCR